MVIRTSRYNPKASIRKLLSKHLCIRDDLLLIVLECGCHSLLKANSFGCNDVHERAALHGWKYRAIELLLKLLATHHHASTRTSQRFVRRSSDKIHVRDWARMETNCDESCNVRNI